MILYHIAAKNKKNLPCRLRIHYSWSRLSCWRISPSGRSRKMRPQIRCTCPQHKRNTNPRRRQTTLLPSTRSRRTRRRERTDLPCKVGRKTPSLRPCSARAFPRRSCGSRLGCRGATRLCRRPRGTSLARNRHRSRSSSDWCTFRPGTRGSHSRCRGGRRASPRPAETCLQGSFCSYKTRCRQHRCPSERARASERVQGTMSM